MSKSYHQQPGRIRHVALAALMAMLVLSQSLAAQQDPGLDKVHLGKTFLGLSNNEQAAQYFRQAIQASPENADAWSGLGTALCRMGEVNEGLTAFEKACNLAPQTSETYLIIGTCHERRGKDGTDDAIAAYRKAVHLDRQNQSAWNQLGTLYQRLGHYNEAASAFEQAIAAAPKFFPAYNNLGTVMLSQGRYAQAIGYYQKSIRLNPDLVGLSIYHNLGIAFLYYGDLERAEAAFIMETTINPDDPDARLNLANIHTLNRRYNEAIAEYYRVLSINPLSREALLDLGIVFLLSKKPGSAQRPLSQLLEFYPEDPAGNYYFGRALFLSGQDEMAEQYLSKAEELGFSENPEEIDSEDMLLPVSPR